MVPKGPWHCKVCLQRVRELGIADITLDRNLMRYLYYRETPADTEEAERVVRVGEWLVVGE